LAKQSGGDYILRIEDTDKKREVKGSKEKLLEALKLFGLNWDEYYVQSERVKENVYKKAADKLIEKGFAFYCNCDPKNAKEGYSKELRDPCRDKELDEGAIKLRVPDNEKVSFTDFVLDKKVEWDTNVIADTTLLKSDGFPTYHLGVVFDDNDMNITHVLRGHDWMPSTPIHLLVYKYLEYKVPNIGHLTDILDPRGGKLSKRSGSVSVEDLMKEGYLPEALLNFVMLLGWAPKDDREMYTLQEFVRDFNVNGFQKSNPVFNRDKLDWFNGEYIRQLPVDELISKFEIRNSKFEKLDESNKSKIVSLVQERVKTLGEFESLAGFFFEAPKKIDKKLFTNEVNDHLGSAVKALSGVEKWDLETINSTLMKMIDDNNYKVGKFFMDLRIAITGSKFTPPINESIEILGKKETIERVEKALE
jgi:glutamyl-tRNA synthetase